MRRATCIEVLQKAFNMSPSESGGLMHSRSEGFEIICRPSQFARFIIYRHEAGECINGIRDLQPELVEADDRYTAIANSTGVHRAAVKLVLQAVNWQGRPDPTVIDVSNRHGDSG